MNKLNLIFNRTIKHFHSAKAEKLQSLTKPNTQLGTWPNWTSSHLYSSFFIKFSLLESGRATYHFLICSKLPHLTHCNIFWHDDTHNRERCVQHTTSQNPPQRQAHTGPPRLRYFRAKSYAGAQGAGFRQRQNKNSDFVSLMGIAKPWKNAINLKVEPKYARFAYSNRARNSLCA